MIGCPLSGGFSERLCFLFVSRGGWRFGVPGFRPCVQLPNFPDPSNQVRREFLILLIDIVCSTWDGWMVRSVVWGPPSLPRGQGPGRCSGGTGRVGQGGGGGGGRSPCGSLGSLSERLGTGRGGSRTVSRLEGGGGDTLTNNVREGRGISSQNC